MKERIISDMAWFSIAGKKVSILQLEIVNSKNLIENRVGDIIEIIQNFKRTRDFSLIFLNLIELEECKNYFIAIDDETKIVVEKVLDVKFHGFVAERSNLIMRKQIVPLLKEELENNLK